MTIQIFLYYCYYTNNIIIIHVSLCFIATESPSFTISQLSTAAQIYFNLGISTATKEAYTAGVHKYNTFCREINQSPLPVCEDTLLLVFTKLIWPNKMYLMQQYKCTFLIWVACCLTSFGLLRVSEFATSSPNHFNSSTDLLLSDVALDNCVSPTTIQTTLKQSKNDQFRTGTIICLGKTTHAVCPVDALVQYLAIRGDTPGSLFLLPNNQSLTRALFRLALKKAFFKSYIWTIASLIHTVLELVLLHQ